MDDDKDDEQVFTPANAFLFAVPNEPGIRSAYEAYKTSASTKRMESERTRTIFSEALIDNERLGTLADLSVRALAKQRNRFIAPSVKRSGAFMRIHYDTLDVNLPLKDCYYVYDARFWRRVVLAKSNDPSLLLKKLEDYDWRANGISLKYVEMVEACPAAYWPEQKMVKLALLVRRHVHSMHISRLQSQSEAYFNKFIDSEGELDASSDFSEGSSVSSDEEDTCESIEEEEEEAPPPPPPPPKKFQEPKEDLEIEEQEKMGTEEDNISEADESETSSVVDVVLRLLEDAAVQRRELSFLNQQIMRREARAQRNALRQKLRDFWLQKKLEHEKRKRERKLKLIRPKPQKKRKMLTNAEDIHGVFDIKVEPEPEDNEGKIPDKRNKQLLLRRIKRYDYPHKDCHHINLSFLRYFDLLTSLTFEFLGPKMDFGYHKRHTRFSYDDMSHLARGIRDLHQLKILRFRNSLMDNIKLILLVRALRNLENLEVVDFGCDDLDDSCNVVLEMLLDRKIMLKSLELEYNRLGKNALDSIGYALRDQDMENPEGTKLEYLGLGHNLLPGPGLHDFVHRIVGTNHIRKLNLNGVGIPGDKLVYIVGDLLRKHNPLLYLDMAANCLNPISGKNLICALESNQKILHFDCRACGLSEDQEFEADIILRRNKYLTVNSFVGDTSLTEEVLHSMLDSRSHPITKKLLDEKRKREVCLKTRIPWPPSSESLVIDIDMEKHQTIESEFDIWKALVGHRLSTIKSRSTFDVSAKSSETFIYHPNQFGLKEFREHLQMPGIGNRYYYFQHQKTFYNV